MNKILIIEDDENMREMVRRMCISAGVKPREFREVRTLDDGLAALAEGDLPDLAFADLTLPPLSEKEVIDLGVRPISSMVPLIIVTGSSNPGVVFDCHAAGAQACLLKQNIVASRCGIEMLAQAIIQATLNWKREHAPETQR